MEKLKAFKSLKAYKFLHNGFVKNVWVHKFPISEVGSLRILYLSIYVHHSLICDASQETYVALNGDNDDVYSIAGKFGGGKSDELTLFEHLAKDSLEIRQ